MIPKTEKGLKDSLKATFASQPIPFEGLYDWLNCLGFNQKEHEDLHIILLTLNSLFDEGKIHIKFHSPPAGEKLGKIYISMSIS